jgi:hypothetical protein
MAKGLSFFASTVLLIAACTTSKTPTSPSSAEQTASGGRGQLGHSDTMPDAAHAPGRVCAVPNKARRPLVGLVGRVSALLVCGAAQTRANPGVTL